MQNNLVIVAHQPNFFPPIKVLNKLNQGTVIVFLDDVQFVRNDIQNRIKFRNLKDLQNEFWVTCSIKKGSSRKKINQVQISDFDNFKKNFIIKVEKNYSKSKSPYYCFLHHYFEEVFKKEYKSLSEFNIHSTITIFEMLGLSNDYILSSSICINENLKNEDKIIAITNELKGDTYLSGLGGKNYIHPNKFKQHNIKLVWHEWIEPSDILIKNWDKISFLDFIARYGPKKLKHYLCCEGEIYEN